VEISSAPLESVLIGRTDLAEEVPMKGKFAVVGTLALAFVS
jgi:hypothetical protein